MSIRLLTGVLHEKIDNTHTEVLVQIPGDKQDEHCFGNCQAVMDFPKVTEKKIQNMVFHDCKRRLSTTLYLFFDFFWL